MSIQSEIIKWIKGLATPAGAKVYDTQAPEDIQFPYVVTTPVDERTPRTLNGQKLFTRATIRCAIFSLRGAERDVIGRSIRDAVQKFVEENGQQGLLGTIRIVSFVASVVDSDVAVLEDETIIKALVIDIAILYRG